MNQTGSASFETVLYTPLARQCYFTDLFHSSGWMDTADLSHTRILHNDVAKLPTRLP